MSLAPSGLGAIEFCSRLLVGRASSAIRAKIDLRATPNTSKQPTELSG
jgi:hypothetical protein